MRAWKSWGGGPRHTDWLYANVAHFGPSNRLRHGTQDLSVGNYTLIVLLRILIGEALYCALASSKTIAVALKVLPLDGLVTTFGIWLWHTEDHSIVASAEACRSREFCFSSSDSLVQKNSLTGWCTVYSSTAFWSGGAYARVLFRWFQFQPCMIFKGSFVCLPFSFSSTMSNSASQSLW
jgi:hypothetical protein